MIKNITQVDFNEENLHNVHFLKVNSMPVIENTKTPRSDIYVENACHIGEDIHTKNLF